MRLLVWVNWFSTWIRSGGSNECKGPINCGESNRNEAVGRSTVFCIVWLDAWWIINWKGCGRGRSGRCQVRRATKIRRGPFSGRYIYNGPILGWVFFFFFFWQWIEG